MKLTNKKITDALKNNGAIRTNNMPAHVFIKADGNRLYISDWGQDMGLFKPTLKGLEADWHIANEETE
jgi:hypothetical protein